MPADQTAPRLCETCRDIDFGSLVTHTTDPWSEWDEDIRFRLVHSDECDLCAILTPDGLHGEEGDLWALRFPDLSPWVDLDENDVFPGVALAVNDADSRYKIFYVPTQHAEVEHVLRKPRPLHQTPDYVAARAWLHQCQDHHGLGCVGSFPPVIDGMRLVDVLDEKIVKVEYLTSPHWVALSYVWGDVQRCQPFKEGDDSLPNNLPKTIEDALKVTQTMGYRYLWTDELCIDQEDHDHRTSQISKMDQIYKGADLIIVAACGNNKSYGLPGVSSTPRFRHTVVQVDQGMIFSIGPEPTISVIKSTWFSRGWTFQEGYLSKRLLFFTDHQMAFMCREQGWMEGLTGPPYVDETIANFKIWPGLWGHYSFRRHDANPDLLSFGNMIMNFTNRQLTHATDALNAVTGVLHHLSTQAHPIYNIVGLPYYRGPSNSTPMFTIGQAIDHALSWSSEVYSRGELKRRDMFPSWTWVGWKGRVVMGDGPAPTNFVQTVALETEFGDLVPLPEQVDAEAGPSFQRQLDSVKIIQFEAPTVPAVWFEFDEEEDVIVCGLPFLAKDLFPPDVQNEIARKIRLGLWECLILDARYIVLDNETDKLAIYNVLVCEWVDGSIAQRVNLVKVEMYHEKIDNFEAILEKRRVRLI